MSASLLQQKANLLRSICLSSTTRAGSGHPSSCLSACDIAAVMFDEYFHYDLLAPDSFMNDRLVLSKGHSAPLLYALFGMSGAYPLSDIDTLRELGSSFEGHPTPHFPFAQGATGSLGQGLSIGAGLAIGLRKRYQISDMRYQMPKIYVLLGDGEMAEGQNWEAANFASHYELSNLIAIVDANGLGQSQKTMFGEDAGQYEERFKAFGFITHLVDGHDFEQINEAFRKANDSKAPAAIIAKTTKGKGVSFIEGKEGWHGKALSEEELARALEELTPLDKELRFDLSVQVEIAVSAIKNSNSILSIKQYKKDSQIATREAFGDALIKIGSNDDQVMVLDADVQNSTYTQEFGKAYPERFIQCFIAEQNMVSVAVGLSKLGLKPVVATFASFLTRAADQIRMAAISRSIIHFCGSHVGVEIGEDGPSQMGLEDIALFGSIPDSIIVQPSDAVSMAKILPELFLRQGITYTRTLRPKTPVIYTEDDDFPIGGSKVLVKSSNDLLTVLATGITVHEALAAAQILEEEGISIRVVDCYSIKPVDKETILSSIEATREKIVITVEDHYEHGGFGDFVLDALSESQAKVIKMAVRSISESGRKDELMHESLIDKDAIVYEVKKVIATL